MNFATCPGGPPGPPWEWALHPPLPATCRRSGAVLSHTPRAGWVYFVEDPKTNLVGGFNHLEKYEFVSWGQGSSQLNGEIKFMFQTTTL